MSKPARYRIWMLSLVFPGRYGRWWTALAILALGAVAYGIAALMTAQDPRYSGRIPWSIPLFFVCAVAYIIPMFHYVTERSHQIIDDLAAYLPPTVQARGLHEAIETRSFGWVVATLITSVAIWLLQSRLLAGGWSAMWADATAGYASVSLILGPLAVWMTMVTCVAALLTNALMVRGLVPSLSIDLFEPRSYVPIGRMVVNSTLVMLGGMALLPVMWLGGPTNWWTTLPALIGFSPLIALLLLLPVLPLHRQLLAQRQSAVEEAQRAVQASRESGDSTATIEEQASALSLRHEISRLPVWPFDIGAVTRFVSYAIIIPLTWAGAALIEMLVNALLE